MTRPGLIDRVARRPDGGFSKRTATAADGEWLRDEAHCVNYAALHKIYRTVG